MTVAGRQNLDVLSRFPRQGAPSHAEAGTGTPGKVPLASVPKSTLCRNKSAVLPGCTLFLASHANSVEGETVGIGRSPETRDPSQPLSDAFEPGNDSFLFAHQRGPVGMRLDQQSQMQRFVRTRTQIPTFSADWQAGSYCGRVLTHLAWGPWAVVVSRERKYNHTMRTAPTKTVSRAKTVSCIRPLPVNAQCLDVPGFRAARY